MKILGIESSCDETAASVVEDGHKIVSSVVATQIPFHEAYKGVVPEIASSKHTEWILPVVKTALQEAGETLQSIDGIAVTNRPGLMGSLLVGLTFAKTLAWACNKPFIAVNHMLGLCTQRILSRTFPIPTSVFWYRADIRLSVKYTILIQSKCSVVLSTMRRAKHSIRLRSSTISAIRAA